MHGFHNAIVGVAAGLIAASGAMANPQGAHVVHGQVGFAAPNASTLNITNTPGAAWHETWST